MPGSGPAGGLFGAAKKPPAAEQDQAAPKLPSLGLGGGAQAPPASAGGLFGKTSEKPKESNAPTSSLFGGSKPQENVAPA